MSATLLKTLQQQLDTTHEQYNLHFAGQMRTTRSTHMMGLMIEAAQTIERDTARIEANGDAKVRQELLSLCGERLELYRNELKAIETARSDAGEDGIEAALLGTRANFIFHRYVRHFAGKGRATRDLSLLKEMGDDLVEIRDQMRELAKRGASSGDSDDLKVVIDYIELFAAEKSEIIAARDAGTLEEQEGTLAELANDQFTLYSQHFAGQSRVSRRPEMLKRMIGALESVLVRMEALQEIGHHSEHNQQNTNIVRERLDMWRTELVAVQNQRQQTPLLAMVEALGEGVDPVLAAYNENFAGQGREGRSRDLLTALCDGLAELERQMERIGSVERLTVNERNLQMIRDALVMFEKEWQAIAEAQNDTA
jgi:hypothetical protein